MKFYASSLADVKNLFSEAKVFRLKYKKLIIYVLVMDSKSLTSRR
jgi:hypothetical protein